MLRRCPKSSLAGQRLDIVTFTQIGATYIQQKWPRPRPSPIIWGLWMRVVWAPITGLPVALFVAFGCSSEYTFPIGILFGLDVGVKWWKCLWLFLLLLPVPLNALFHLRYCLGLMLGNSDGQMMEMHVALFVAFGCSYKYTFPIGILYGLDVR